VCPYCGVGCGQRVYHKNGKLISIEGDPDSPVSRGRLCPKAADTFELHTHPARLKKVKYRRPYSRHWEELDLETALDMEVGQFTEGQRQFLDYHRTAFCPRSPDELLCCGYRLRLVPVACVQA
jgi:formate dehydrogenase major subunit